MGKLSIGDFVKHTQDPHRVFQILDELTSVPPGGPSLYRCMPLHDESRLYKYLETDLYSVTLEQARNDHDVYELGDFELRQDTGSSPHSMSIDGRGGS